MKLRFAGWEEVIGSALHSLLFFSCEAYNSESGIPKSETWIAIERSVACAARGQLLHEQSLRQGRSRYRPFGFFD
jgi:hypothetical protein